MSFDYHLARMVLSLLRVDHFTPEEIERFKNDPEFFWNFRYSLEQEFNVRVYSALRLIYVSHNLTLFIERPLMDAARL